MGTSRLLLNASAAPGTPQILKDFVNLGISQTSDLFSLMKTDDRYRSLYYGIMSKADRVQKLRLSYNNKIFKTTEWNESNLNQYVDSDGIPYYKNGDVVVVISEFYRTFTSDRFSGGAVESASRPLSSWAIRESVTNRIYISPLFAEMIRAGEVRYLATDGKYYEYDLKTIIAHEFGHSGDVYIGDKVGSNTNIDDSFNNSAEFLEKLVNKVAADQGGGLGVRKPHGPLQFKALDGTWISSRDVNDPAKPAFHEFQELINKIRSDLGMPLATAQDFEDIRYGLESLYTAGGEEQSLTGEVIRVVSAIASDVLEIDGGQLGLALGSVLGRRLTSDPFGQIGASAALSTVLGAFGEAIDEALGGTPSTHLLDSGLESLGQEFVNNAIGAGVGAVSSYLTAELVNSLGLQGTIGEITNTAANSALSRVLTNILADEPVFQNVGPAIVNAAASYLGTQLAKEIYSPDTVGGQIGAQVGTAYGSWVAGNILAVSGVTPVSFVIAVVAVAFWTVVGGLIGSIFGGTPRSGADSSWDAKSGTFTVANIWSKHGAGESTARSLAQAVTDNFNNVLSASGAALLNPSIVKTGNYGMHKKDFVYRVAGGVSASFNGDHGAEKLINHGTYLGLASMIGQMAGGDIYVKRAIAGNLANAGGNPQSSAVGAAGNFDMTTLAGDVTVASDYANYLENSVAINALIAADPLTSFAAGWLITLARAEELGLNRRSYTDWTGGYSIFLDETADGVIDGQGFGASQLGFGIDETTGLRYWAVTGGDGSFLGFIQDTLEAGSVTQVEGTAAAETIDLRAQAIDVAATVDGGGGNDTIYASDRGDNLFGGAGNDTLYGGRLDDWLLGGDGNDNLYAAGPAQGALGGDGNYLDGGAGNDILTGAEGSDWLEGGDGDDTLLGGAADDILAGGAGIDEMEGGEGADRYLFRRGDGADIAEDGTGSIGAGDSLTALIAAKNAGTLARDWFGTGIYSEHGALYDGNDRVVFGAGIGLADIQLKRSGTSGAPGMDLIVVITQDGVATGDQLTLSGWFDSFKRVEWLEFADGQAVRIGDFASFVTGTPGNDIFYGTNGSDFVIGGEGNDFFSLAGGDDVGIGGAGEDEVGGDDGNDILIGGRDNDLLLGGDGHDILSGDAGNDKLNGGFGNDLLTGGLGNDFMAGGTGNDIFRVSRGDGLDTIIDDYAGTWETVWNSSSGWAAGYSYDQGTGQILKNGTEVIFDGTKWIGDFNYNYVTQTEIGSLVRLIPSAGGQVGKDAATNDSDSLEFGLGINIQDLVLQKVGDDLILAISSENANDTAFANIADRITLKDWFVGAAPSGAPIESFVFAATGTLTMTSTRVGLQGTDGNDNFVGTASRDWITGGAGDDNLVAYAGDDIVVGNAGQDRLDGHYGNDILYGGQGDDILVGGTGADRLSGGEGSDTASYYTAGTNAVYAYLDNAAMNSGDAQGDTYVGIENLTGGNGADHLGGDSGQNVLTGNAGNDTLLGGLGDDTYVFEAHSNGDVIQDGAFTIEQAVDASGILAAGYSVSWTSNGLVNNLYQYRLIVTNGSGEIALDGLYNYSTTQVNAPTPSAWASADWKNGYGRVGATVQAIREKFDASVDGGDDVLEFGAGISLSDVTATWSGNDLAISVYAYSAARIKNQAIANQQIETLIFNDGLSVNLANIRLNTNGLDGADDFILGTTGSDTLSGLSGNDVISGAYGNDTLYGGDGDDVLEGGAHSDTLNGGAGNDTARYVRSSAAVTVNLALSTGQSGGDAAGDVLVGIENVVGSTAGNDVLTGNAEDNRLFGLEGNDTLSGAAGNDVLVGDLGDDVLSGGDGEDNISGGNGDDTIAGGNHKDLIDGGAGNDAAHGDAGNDTLSGGSGNDTLFGDDGDDILSGGDDDDTLWGGAGNDTLSGDAGNDILHGEAGDDVYVFSANSGTDTVVDASGTNGIVFESSVDSKNIWLARAGNDLVISVIGGSTQITVGNFYAPSTPTVLRYIATPTHALYLAYAQPLIAQMGAYSSLAPAVAPETIAAAQSAYWWQGGKASPTVQDIALTILEDTNSIPQGVGAIDHDENITGYQLGAGPANGSALVDAMTGQFQYTPDADFNGSDRFSVVVSDADGHAATVTIDVTVTAVNDAPRDLRVADGSQITVLEGASGSPTLADSPVEQMAATDVEGDPMNWSLVNDAGGRFDITAAGMLIVENPAFLNYEDDSTHTIRVRVEDAYGAAAEKDFVVSLLNWNEAPDTPLLSQSRSLVGESLSSGMANSWVARFTLADVDGPAPALRLVSNPSNRFKVVGNEVRFADNYEPDFEALYNSGMAASDSDGDGQMEVVLSGSVDATDGELSSPGSTTFSIRIEDVNEAPTALNWSPNVASIAERDRVAIGTALPAITIGTLSVSDPDIAGFDGNSYTYAVSDSRFEIVGNVLRLKQGAVLDYEAGSSVSFTITATDQSSAPLSIQRSINVTVDNLDDVLEGNATNNSLIGQQNRDLLYGYGGNDYLDGADGDDLLDGGAGDDDVHGKGGNDTVYGREGADLLHGGVGNDVLYGGANDIGTFDILYGGDGDDQLYGEDGDDLLRGGLGTDLLNGGAGSDWADYSFIRSGEADVVGVSADLVTPASNTGAALGDSYSGIENLRGTGVADMLGGDAFANKLEGLEGDDVLRGRAGNDILQGGIGNDTLYGDDGADDLQGGDGADIIYGGAGNDTLLGGAGTDQLYAESGDDYLDGGIGNDTLNGGIDNDTYIVTRTSEADTIYNYDPSGDDIDVLGFQDADGAINDLDLWFEKVGNDMRISVIDTTSSVLIKDWYLISDPGSRANYKIDFIVAGSRFSKQINVEGLVQLMASQTKPATIAQRDALMNDPTYHAQWSAFWGNNLKPVIAPIGNRSMNEDGPINFTVTATDDITPNANVMMSATVISGTSVIANSGLVFGTANSSGVRSLTITPLAQRSGTAVIRVQATDAGGLTETQEFTVTVNPVADMPTVTQFTGGSGTAGEGSGISLTLSVTFPDMDGSEAQEIRISGVPSGTTLSAGVYDSGLAVWKLTPAQASGLKIIAPTGWSQDLTLTATARATEGGQTAVSPGVTTTVVINAPPTGANLSTSAINENAANGTAVGNVVGIDPDAGDTLTYTLVDSAGGRFSLNAAGALSVANGTLLNYENATTHNIIVRVTDSFGKIYNKTLAIAVNNVNEANSLPTSYTFAVNENLSSAIVGTVAASDLDSSSVAYGKQRYYFLNGSTASTDSSDGRYTIDTVSGVIRTRSALNYENGTPIVNYQVIARDNQGAAGYNQAATTVQIGINNVNEANSWPTSYTFSVNENLSGATVGTVVASDLDGSGVAYGKQRYYFWNGSTSSSDSSDGRYTIDAVSGVIRTRYALNYESGTPIVNYQVVARDNQGAAGYNQVATTVQIGINNVNEANSWPTISPLWVNENLSGATVGTVVASDLDGSGVAYGKQRYYFLNGSTASANSSDGRYTIDAVSGVIRTRSALNYESGTPIVDYQVIARDNQGAAGYNQVATTVRIGVKDVNEAPIFNDQYKPIYETDGNYNPQNKVATLDISDPDINDSYKDFRFQIVGGNTGNIFRIDNSGNLFLNTGINYENPNQPKSYNLTVGVWDQGYGGNYVERNIAIDVLNKNEPPQIYAGDLTITYNVYWYYYTYNMTETRIGVWESFFNYTVSDPDGSGAPFTMSYSNAQASSPTGVWHSVNPVHRDYNEWGEFVWPNWTTMQVASSDYFMAYGEHPGVKVTLSATDSDGAVGTAYVDRTAAGYNVPPIVLDLDGDGVELTSLVDTPVRFDMDGDGSRDLTGWVGADDGLLAIDLNGNGLIDDVTEISFRPLLDDAMSDLEGLRFYDSNEDGVLDAGDLRFGDFRVWQDANQNGVSDAGELRTLDQVDIAAINLTLTPTGDTWNSDQFENVIYGYSDYVRTDGTIGTIGDALFTFLKDGGANIILGGHGQVVALDLDGNGVAVTDLATSNINFDYASAEPSQSTAWVGSGEAMLVVDLDGNGAIDTGNELALGHDRFSLSPLHSLDENGDARVDANDSRFADLLVWQDANQDGISQSGELATMQQRGVAAFVLSDKPSPLVVGVGESRAFGSFAVEYADGTSGSGTNVLLAYADQMAQAMASFAPGAGEDMSTGAMQPQDDHYHLTAAAA